MVHGLLYMTFIAITWMFCFNAFSCGRRLKIHKVLQNLFLLCPWHLLEISHILWLNFKVWRVSEGSWCSKHGDLGAEGVLIQICDENFFSNFNRNYSNFCTFCAYASTRDWRLKTWISDHGDCTLDHMWKRRWQAVSFSFKKPYYTALFEVKLTEVISIWMATDHYLMQFMWWSGIAGTGEEFFF